MHTSVRFPAAPCGRMSAAGLALAFFLVCSAVSSSADVVMNDGFTDGGRTHGVDPADGEWWAQGGTTLAVVDDSAGIGAGNALQITPSSIGSRGAVAHLPAPVTLHEEGDTITLFFRWRFTGTTALNQTMRLRFGLYGTHGTRTVADGADTPRHNDTGYFAATNPGLAGSATTIQREVTGDDVLGGTNFTDVTATAGASVSAGTAVHTALLTLVRVGASVSITASIDGLAPATSTLTALTTYTFDQVAISLGYGTVSSSLLVDDVQVEYYNAARIEDGFTDGSRSAGGFAGDMEWFTLGSPSVIVVDDSGGIGFGNALQLTPLSTGRGLVAGFPPVFLDDGDSLALTFNWRFTGTTGLNQAKNLRFGLHSSNGTPVTSDASSATNNDKGYFVAINPGASGSSVILHREAGGDGGILGGNDWSTFGAHGMSLNAGTAPHFASLTLTRSGSSLLVNAQVDNLAPATGTSTSIVTNTFDQFAITLAGATLPSPLRIDNVTIDHLPAPIAQTVGGGTIASPAVGPTPAHGVGGGGYTLVKNWNFGTNGTVTNIADLSTHFQYHDQFGMIANSNYGAYIVAPDYATRRGSQPVEGVNTATPVREFFADSMKTYIVPLDGATELRASPTITAGSGSFMAKWSLPKGGSRLGQDMIWETRVRYVVPPYFWFALWTSGNKWTNGAEYDLIESFGYDNGGGFTNYNGRYWHSSVVGGTQGTYYHSSWNNGMTSRGIRWYDASEWHVWTWHYRKDDTYTAYVDGIPVQEGTLEWTRGGTPTGEQIDMRFLFDGTWGSRTVGGVKDKVLPVSQLAGTFYEWDYSRVYLKD